MKNTISRIAAVTTLISLLSICGCSQNTEPAPEQQNDVTAESTSSLPTIAVYKDYALIPGHTVYVSPDSAFSIQLPEGNNVNDADPTNVIISLSGTFANPDIVTITKVNDANAVYTEGQLYDLLADDNSIDVTGFYLLTDAESGSYKGYKYSFVSYADPQQKGITSTYFSPDGSAYVVDATINNGGDETNVNNINLLIDTFINY